MSEGGFVWGALVLVWAGLAALRLLVLHTDRAVRQDWGDE